MHWDRLARLKLQVVWEIRAQRNIMIAHSKILIIDPGGDLLFFCFYFLGLSRSFSETNDVSSRCEAV